MKKGISIRTQVVVLLIISQIIALATAMALLWQGPGGARLPLPVAIATAGLEPLITVVGTVEQLPPTQVDMVVEAALRHDSRLELTGGRPTPPDADLMFPARAGIRALRAAFPEVSDDRLRVWAPAPKSGGLFQMVRYQAGYLMADGRWLVFTPGDETIARSFPPAMLFLMLMLLTLPAAAVMIWAGGTLVAPVRQLATRAENFGSDLAIAPIRPRGPYEVRVLARALNDMYARVRELVDARSMTLAAIGHDLRTPLTRLRLRAEMLEEPDAKEAILRDTATMTRMIDTALNYIRGQQAELEPAPFDLSAMIKTVCDELENDPDRIRLNLADRVVARGDPEQIKRALSNLIENALEHGTLADMRIVQRNDQNVIVVADDGPGVPADERQRLLQPFQRGDMARGDRPAGGFGLGLAIANDVVQRHGGTLELADNAPRGLKVIITLPA